MMWKATSTNICAIGLLYVLLFSGCATTSHYHVTDSSKSGFSKTRLAKNIYQVRFDGDEKTSKIKISQFLLRRCAQLTLEHGKRFFLVSNYGSASRDYKRDVYYSEQTIMKILNHNIEGEHDIVLDAVTIVKNTNKMAEGKLSPKAKKRWMLLKDPQTDSKSWTLKVMEKMISINAPAISSHIMLILFLTL